MPVIIIPARLDSLRLPNKPLACREGRPLIWWTWRQAIRVQNADVAIATCDNEIEQAVVELGMRCIRTSETCQSGTHRAAEAAAWMGLNSKEVVVDWQVDEPGIQPEWVEQMLALLEQQPAADMTTLVAPLPHKIANDCHTTKAVVSNLGRCHWFSRAPMTGARAHLGIYACSMLTLQAMGRIGRSSLSIAEGLEQLTWLEHGWTIYAHTVTEPLPVAINTEEDLSRWQENA